LIENSAVGAEKKQPETTNTVAKRMILNSFSVKPEWTGNEKQIGKVPAENQDREEDVITR
jgi:hypothetical protein